MTDTLKITDAITTIVLDLWGNKYRTKPLTKSGEQRLEDLGEQFEKIDTDSDEATIDLAKLHAEVIAVCTEPIDGATEDVAALVAEKYEADELVFANLIRFSAEAKKATQDPFADRR